MQVLITGAGGFLGSTIARKLLAKGYNVRGFSRNSYPAIEALGVLMHRGDLADRTAVLKVVKGCDIVFHVAAKAGVWGPYDEYFQPNVVGTENVIEACKTHKISRLVYTSSPCVTFNGNDEDGVDESSSYAGKYLCHYAETKAMAEKMVLAANSNTLATVALRPHLIWGPGDNHLIPRLLQQVRAGKLWFVGKRSNKVNPVYIDNAAEAHVLAAEKLTPGSACAGKAYYIANKEPLPMNDFINMILTAANTPPISRSIPVSVAYAIAALMEFTYKTLRCKEELLMTRFMVLQLSATHWFDISAAKRDFGYQPRISLQEGLKRLKQSFST